MLMLSRGVGIDFENNLAVVDSTEAAVPEDHFPETETDSEPVPVSYTHLTLPTTPYV